MSKKAIKWILIGLAIVSLIVIYTVFNPNSSSYFPKCPFKMLTGFKCPGCGSQRAVHHLLNFNIKNAINENAILVLSIPYIILGFIYDIKKKHTAKSLIWRKRLFGQKAIIAVLTIIIAFWIYRNIVLLI